MKIKIPLLFIGTFLVTVILSWYGLSKLHHVLTTKNGGSELVQEIDTKTPKSQFNAQQCVSGSDSKGCEWIVVNKKTSACFRMSQDQDIKVPPSPTKLEALQGSRNIALDVEIENGLCEAVLMTLSSIEEYEYANGRFSWFYIIKDGGSNDFY